MRDSRGAECHAAPCAPARGGQCARIGQDLGPGLQKCASGRGNSSVRRTAAARGPQAHRALGRVAGQHQGSRLHARAGRLGLHHPHARRPRRRADGGRQAGLSQCHRALGQTRCRLLAQQGKSGQGPRGDERLLSRARRPRFNAKNSTHRPPKNTCCSRPPTSRSPALAVCAPLAQAMPGCRKIAWLPCKQGYSPCPV